MWKRAPFLVAAMVTAAGCGTTTPRAPTAVAPAAAVDAVAPNDTLDAVAWMQTAVEHDLVYREVFRNAGEKLLKALADPTWDALPYVERMESARELPPAIIVDIDETILDNSPYEARLIRAGDVYGEATWAAWCREKSARALPGARAFAELADRHGVSVFYISNRARALDDVTLDNLRNEGFPLPAGTTTLLDPGTVVAGCTTRGSDKGCRRRMVGRTHRVLLQLGDQIGDFVDVAANTPAGRRAALEPYDAWIGERWFVLPNPAYGSWEPALFDNDRSLTAGQRRAAKLGKLRTD
jgi:5'-nucleotidase (lipoprotein e(P4) family)